jgi:APA family basic amino acid/polyamine antiporter
MQRLFARKSIESLTSSAEAESSLPRTLGLFSLICFGVGSTIGAGIFVLTGTVAAEHAGPAVALSFVIASIACAFAGLCYAEFAALVPVAGSAYTYAYTSFGEAVAWIVGWCLVLEYLFASALVAIGWSGYAVSLGADLGLTVPAAILQAPFDVSASGIVSTGAAMNVPAICATLLCTALLLIGTQVSARVNGAIVLINILAILVVGTAGLMHAQKSHWTPFVPANMGHFGEFGLSGVCAGAAIVFYAYVGFDAVSTLSQETRNPTRVVPMALIGALGICTFLYVLVAMMTTGLIDYHLLGVPNPVSVALSAAGPSLAWAKVLVDVVIAVSLVSALLVTLLGQIRIFYAMSRDGLLPPMFASIHPKWRTPHLGTLVTGVTAAVIAGLFPLKLLGELISIGTLLAFMVVCLGVIVLRRQRPDLQRPFRVPGYPWTPVLGVVSCLALMLSLPRDTWIRLAVWLILGAVVYLAYGSRHSLLRQNASTVLSAVGE